MAIANNVDAAARFIDHLDFALNTFMWIYIVCALILLFYYLSWVSRNIEPPLRRFRWYAIGFSFLIIVPFLFARRVSIGETKNLPPSPMVKNPESQIKP